MVITSKPSVSPRLLAERLSDAGFTVHTLEMDGPVNYVKGVIAIRRILRETKRIALVGASANEARPSWIVTKYLLDRGYDVVPVNPGLAGQTILGKTVYASLKDIPGPIDMVEIFRNSEAAGPITGEALALPLVETAGSAGIGDAVFDEIFHPISARLLSHCDAVLRIGGPSTGADYMLQVAREKGKRCIQAWTRSRSCSMYCSGTCRS